MRAHFFCITLLFLFSWAYCSTNIAFQEVASGTNTGFAFCGRNHVIESETAFTAFCDSINLDPQGLSYSPNFNSVQLIGIVYEQSTIQAWHFISAVINSGDTTWIEITYSTPPPLPPGTTPYPGYKYQIVAIPKQSNPVAFRLVQFTQVNDPGPKKNATPLNRSKGSNYSCDLLGRQIPNIYIRNSGGMKIFRNKTKCFQKSSYY